MKYKMFVSDLDGTLLSDDHKISKENIKAIKELEAKGVKFVVATGRTKYILEDFLEILDYKMPFIWSNGSAVSDAMGETLYTEEIEIEVAKNIIKLAHEHKIDYMIHTLDGLVSEHNNPRILELEHYNEGVKEEHRIPLKTDKLLSNRLEHYELLKISVSSETSQALCEFQEIINGNIEQINAVFSASTLLDITAKKASKGQAVLKLAAKYNIDPKEIIAIGDNENDLSMLEICGLPLTLENGVDSVKEIAKYITKNNNSSGVADAIQRFVL